MLPALPFYPSHPPAIALIIIGAVVGVISGMLGIGGGVLVIPLLVLFFHFPHERAIGTSLGMLLPPVGLFAVAQYWRAGFVDVRSAGIMAGMFAGGAWVGSWIITNYHLPEKSLRLSFGLFLVYVAANMLFRSDSQIWAAVRALLLVAFFGGIYFVMHQLGRRWDRPMSLREMYLQKSKTPVAPDYEI